MPMLQQAKSLGWSSLGPISLFDRECPSEKYLAFASADMKDGNSDRHCVNAVSNAKRALHLRVETLAGAYGGKSRDRRSSSFPAKLDFCKGCGVISPAILRRLNAIRNAIEHEYRVPSEEQALDFVDIVDLFLEATSWLVFKFPAHLELASEGIGYWFQLRCAPRSGVINVKRFDKVGDPDLSTSSFDVSAQDEDAYTSWMGLILDKARQSQIRMD